MNNHRVVFGLLYDKKERTFPFRWKNGRMTVLRGPNGRMRQADVPDRNAINERGEIAGNAASSAAGGARCVGRARARRRFLPALPGHTWTNAWSIGRTASCPGGRAGCPTMTARTTR